jgi:hypothetical protein
MVPLTTRRPGTSVALVLTSSGTCATDDPSDAAATGAEGVALACGDAGWLHDNARHGSSPNTRNRIELAPRLGREGKALATLPRHLRRAACHFAPFGLLLQSELAEPGAKTDVLGGHVDEKRTTRSAE